MTAPVDLLSFYQKPNVWLIRRGAFILLIALIAGHFGCNPDEGVSDPGERELMVDLTDAAVDDEQVAGVYLTFKELYIDDLPGGNFT